MGEMRNTYKIWSENLKGRDSCKHGNEPFDSIKGREFFD
jgi:hypothetical protein